MELSEEVIDWIGMLNSDTYIEIQEMLNYLCGPDYIKGTEIRQDHGHLLLRLAYKAPYLEHDAVVEFLRGIQAARKAPQDTSHDKKESSKETCK